MKKKSFKYYNPKCKITLGDIMKFERDERRFDFHKIGLAIKRAMEKAGMTQEELAYVIDRAPRTIMYNENNGQLPSLKAFYQMVTMFGISVDQYFARVKMRKAVAARRLMLCSAL